jgi:hypothetical protein
MSASHASPSARNFGRSHLTLDRNQSLAIDDSRRARICACQLNSHQPRTPFRIHALPVARGGRWLGSHGIISRCFGTFAPRDSEWSCDRTTAPSTQVHFWKPNRATCGRGPTGVSLFCARSPKQMQNNPMLSLLARQKRVKQASEL